ncbi:hypothetical protein ACQKWADRAFT_307386 [Trichoderma austrokoningii]
MLFKFSTLALVALLGFQAHAQLTAADMVNDIENIDEVYDEAINYLASHGPDSADFNSSIDGFFDRLTYEYTEAIADSTAVQLSVSDQASVANAMIKLDTTRIRFEEALEARNVVSEDPTAELIEELRKNFLVKLVNDLPILDEKFGIGI